MTAKAKWAVILMAMTDLMTLHNLTSSRHVRSFVHMSGSRFGLRKLVGPTENEIEMNPYHTEVVVA